MSLFSSQGVQSIKRYTDELCMEFEKKYRELIKEI
jgi:hypothetical protein